MNVELYSGTGRLAYMCVDLLGVEHVDPGDWMHPVTLVGVTQDDVDSIIELAAEQGVEINYREIM